MHQALHIGRHDVLGAGLRESGFREQEEGQDEVRCEGKLDGQTYGDTRGEDCLLEGFARRNTVPEIVEIAEIAREFTVASLISNLRAQVRTQPFAATECGSEWECRTPWWPCLACGNGRLEMRSRP